jgi:phospholipid/cholesterol/gamma-HCH transport system ATP-binding protein
MSGETLITFRGVRKQFGEQLIYDSLDLEIRRGETMVVLGESGTGKSVLLKMLIGLLKADAGEIIFDGTELTALRESEFLPVRKRIAMLFQGSALFDSLNVYENIAYPLREHKELKEEEIKRVVREKLDLVGLEDVEAKFPAQLSGGMKKRVALARALAGEPEVLLYDEPTTGLDPPNTRRISDLICALQKKLQVTSVVVTHDMASAFLVGDRLSLLGEGRILTTLTRDEFQRSAMPEIRDFMEAMPHLTDVVAENGL